ncbi:MAG TPA: hypothetical protein VKT53_17535 [Candidatus Acidoferrum sp.]|nr:hypothetical protein [Candidatus Acidoferrum sp.]
MIPSLPEIARQLGVSPSFFALAVAGVLTGFALLAQSIARWFDDRDS